MFCLYTLPLARPAQAKIKMLTTSSPIVTILLKTFLKSLRLYLAIEFTVITESSETNPGVIKVIRTSSNSHSEVIRELIIVQFIE